jgi:hypothetical protein
LKQRKEEIARCEQIIAEKVEPLLQMKKVQPQIFTDGHRLKTLSVES